MAWRERLRGLAAGFERELSALALACRDPRVGWPVRLLALLVVVYIVSPIDPIPDEAHLFVLDDVLVLLLGFLVARRLVPSEVMADCRARAATRPLRDLRWWVVVLIVIAWQVGLALLGWWRGGPPAPGIPPA
jgi:uncharacterized membrane protein YkvA (DUF1232 family)